MICGAADVFTVHRGRLVTHAMEGITPDETMFIAADRDDLHKIVVINPKGGSGKTTLATNIAGYYAMRGPAPTLVDCDPLGFSMRWLEIRPDHLATVNGVAAYEETMPNSRTVYVESAPETEKLIIDLPAGIGMNELVDVTYGAGSILIPVMPSEIDVYSTSRFIAELLLVAQIDRRDCQLAVVANRTRQNTRSFKALMRFLFSLKIPVITALRDSQNFVHAAANGMCLHEMPAHKTKKDIAQMDLIVTWLDQWGARRLDSFNAHRFDYESVEPVFVTSRFRNAR